MLCVYCNEREATTEDHVVPEGFFPEAPTQGYVRVRACEPCNNGHSRDEEYLLAVLLAQGTGRSDEANEILNRWSRDHETGARRRTGLGRRLVDAVEPVELHSEAGIYLGTERAVRLEVDRVNRVLEKIVRGLFFHEFGRRLPDDVTLRVELDPEFDRLRHGPFPHAMVRVPKRLGDVFTWRVVALPESPDFTVWVLTFYDSVLATAVTGRAQTSV
jgi:hypothetical protein